MARGLYDDGIQACRILELLGNVTDIRCPISHHINHGHSVTVSQALSYLRVELCILAERWGRVGHAVLFQLACQISYIYARGNHVYLFLIYRAPKLLLPQDTGGPQTSFPSTRRISRKGENRTLVLLQWQRPKVLASTISR